MNIWDRIKLAFNRKPQAPIIKAEETIDNGQFMYEPVKETPPIPPAKKPRKPRKKKDVQDKV